MSQTEQRPEGFDAVKARLEEIANAVSNDDMPLDEALDLFEEAVALGMQVSDLLEEGVFVNEDELSEEGLSAANGTAGAAAEAVGAAETNAQEAGEQPGQVL